MQQGFRIGEWQVQPDLGTLTRGKTQVQVEPKAMAVLVYLAEHAGELVPKERLMRAVWPDTFVGDDVLAHAISILRKAFGEDAVNSTHIRTLPRRGYQLLAEVVFAEEGRPEPGPSRSRPVHRSEMVHGARKSLRKVAREVPWLVLSIVAVLLLVVGTAAFLMWIPSADQGSERASVLQAVPFTTLPGSEYNPDLSPKGDRVAFHWFQADPSRDLFTFDIWVKQIGEGDSRLQLTTDPAPDRFARWSPNGREIAFARWYPDKIGILTVPSLGGAETTLVELDKNPRRDLGLNSISWSPDGERLALSYRPAGEYEAGVFLLNKATRELVPFTSPPVGAWGDYFGQFSPDGKWLAFFRRSTFETWNLYLQDLEKGDPVPLTAESFPLACGLAWMPDSREIVFSAGPIRYASLWRIGLSGGAPTPLLGSGENLSREYPAISPQGGRLVYEELVPQQSDIWRIPNPRVNPSDQVPSLFISSSRDEWTPVYSPDGRRIAFSSIRTGTMQIYICNSDGSQVRPLTDLKSFSTSPSWSPDSTRISFMSEAAGSSDIYVVSAEGGTVRQLTTNPSDDTLPTWSLDGRWIYFASSRTGEFQTWKVPAEGGEPVQVTRMGGHIAREAPDGYLYYGKTSPGEIWKIPREGGEETPFLRQTVRWWHWGLGRQGIYFHIRQRKGQAWDLRVQFLDFKGGEIQPVLSLDVRDAPADFCVSPDEQWFLVNLYTLASGADLMLVEDFY